MRWGWQVTLGGWRWEARSYVRAQGVGYIPENAEYPTPWRMHGRAFTRRGAVRLAKIGLAERVGVEL